MAAGDLTSVDAVKAYLGVNADAVYDDTVIGSLVTACSKYVQTWMNRQILTNVYSDTLNGNGKHFMVLQEFPVAEVLSVNIGGRDIPKSNGLTEPGFFMNDRAVYLRHGIVFERGVGNVSISYRAGYDKCPVDLAQAVVEMVALRYRERDRIGHASKTLGGETVAFTITDFPVQVRTILNNYKQVYAL